MSVGTYINQSIAHDSTGWLRDRCGLREALTCMQHDGSISACLDRQRDISRGGLNRSLGRLGSKEVREVIGVARR